MWSLAFYVEHVRRLGALRAWGTHGMRSHLEPCPEAEERGHGRAAALNPDLTLITWGLPIPGPKGVRLPSEILNAQLNLDIRGRSKSFFRDFPGGPVVKNPPSSAGDAGSIPGRGTKIPHATGQPSPRATTTEPTRSGACAPQLEKRKPACHN